MFIQQTQASLNLIPFCARLNVRSGMTSLWQPLPQFFQSLPHRAQNIAETNKWNYWLHDLQSLEPARDGLLIGLITPPKASSLNQDDIVESTVYKQ